MAAVGNYHPELRSEYQGSSGRYQGLPPAGAHVLDPRLALIHRLSPRALRGQSVLDVGCNSGMVTVQLAFSFGAAAVTGVDVDPDLIRRAHGHLSFQMSRMKPGEPAGSTLYFPVSSVLEHGHRPSLRRGEGVEQDDVSVLSNDVRFDCEDWVVVDASSPRQRRYDTILALSVVKWIHLQHLDAGLARFFSKCQTSLHLHGYLILEVQPWSSYEKAVRPHKSPHLAANLTQLEIRPDDFDDILLGLGFVKVRTSDELPRRIDIYQKVEED